MAKIELVLHDMLSKRLSNMNKKIKHLDYDKF